MLKSAPAVLHRRRLFLKAVPVLLLILLIVGTAFAFTWISNMIQTNVTVSGLAAVTITGSFATQAYVGVATQQDFNYNITSGTPTGWVMIQLNGLTSTSDIAITCYVNNTGIVTNLALMSGYPKVSESYTTLFGGNENTPFNFGAHGTNGTITVNITYPKSGSVTASLQLTSTSS